MIMPRPDDPVKRQEVFRRGPVGRKGSGACGHIERVRGDDGEGDQPVEKKAPSPQSHRVARSPGIRKDCQPGRYCSSGGNHPWSGQPDNGHAAASTEDQGGNPVDACRCSSPPLNRTSAPPDRNHQRLSRSESGIPQALGLSIPSFRMAPKAGFERERVSPPPPGFEARSSMRDLPHRCAA